MRGLIAGAVRSVAALRPAVTALDLAGLSWRRLRAFQRGAGCLADCGEGHTYGVWCQMGWATPNLDWLLHAVSLAAFPLPRPPELEPVTCGDLLSACTHDGPHVPVGLDGEPVDTEGDCPAGCQAAECFGMACMTECTSSHRLERYLADTVGRLAEHPLVDSVHLVHLPSCASIADAEGKAGPCDCGVEEAP